MDQVLVVDRATGQKIVEPAWGERSLRWFYPPERLPLWKSWLRKQAVQLGFPTRAMGWWFSRPKSRALIEPFCEQFGVEISDFIVPEGGYRSFNEFFQRHLRSGKRPLSGGPEVIICPSDGRVRIYKELPGSLEIKGRRVGLRDLLGDGPGLEALQDSSVALIRLCPFDYHRFHYPTGGRVQTRNILPGPLWSVHPWAERAMPDVWWRNRRDCDWVASPFGPYAYVAIGATGVGAIIETSEVGCEVSRGEERGAFALGGSALALFFPRKSVQWDEDLCRHTKSGLETYCQMGTCLGRWRQS